MRRKNQFYAKRWNIAFFLGLALIILAFLNVVRLLKNPAALFIPRWLIDFMNSGFSSLILFSVGLLFLLIARNRYRKYLGIIRRRKAMAARSAREAQIRTGPAVAAIGGGTGLSTILRGLKNITYMPVPLSPLQTTAAALAVLSAAAMLCLPAISAIVWWPYLPGKEPWSSYLITV